MSNNFPRNTHFCSFASFLIILLTPFINNPDSSRDTTCPIKGNPVFSNGTESLPKNPPDSLILRN